MRNFEKYTGIPKETAPIWISELFNLFEKLFDYYLSRYAVEKKVSIKSKENLFEICWYLLYRTIRNDLGLYTNPQPLPTDGLSIISQLLTNPILLRKDIKKDTVANEICLTLAPIFIILNEYVGEKVYLEEIIRAMAKINNDLRNNSPMDIWYAEIESELLQVLNPLRFNDRIGYRRKGYLKEIGTAISPIYQKHSNAFGGNRREFINKYYDKIRRSLKLDKDSFKIPSFEKYI